MNQKNHRWIRHWLYFRGAGGSIPPPPQSLARCLLPLSSHKKNSRCGHEKYSGMLLILAQAALASTTSPLPAFQAGYMYVLPVHSLHIPSLICVIIFSNRPRSAGSVVCTFQFLSASQCCQLQFCDDYGKHSQNACYP